MQTFTIPLDMPAGRHEYNWRLGKGFFDAFDNAEILDADIAVAVQAEKSSESILADVHISGVLTVACDRCLADLACPIDTTAGLRLKHGGDSCDIDQDGREIICIDREDTEFDLGQIIYDYACLALPIQRMHPDGQCDESVVSRMIDNSPKPDESDVSPFASLKDLFKN